MLAFLEIQGFRPTSTNGLRREEKRREEKRREEITEACRLCTVFLRAALQSVPSANCVFHE